MIEIPAGGYPAHQGERLKDDSGTGQGPLPANSKPHDQQKEG